jgi:hypothetical protein
MMADAKPEETLKIRLPARRSYARPLVDRVITDQLMPLTRTLRGGTIFPVISTTPSRSRRGITH